MYPPVFCYTIIAGHSCRGVAIRLAVDPPFFSRRESFSPSDFTEGGDAYDSIRNNGIAVLFDSGVPVGISVRKRTKEKEITAPDQRIAVISYNHISEGQP